MSNLAFLGLVLVLSAIGCAGLWLRHRQPNTMEAQMDAFARELRAMAPESHAGRGRRPA